MGNNFNEARSTVLILFNVEKIILNYLRSLYGSILDFWHMAHFPCLLLITKFIKYFTTVQEC